MNERTLARFLKKITHEGECWIWQGSKWRGYGKLMTENGRPAWAHRLSYEHYTGELPRSIHHLCHNPSCVNPAHLAEMDRAEHSRLHAAKRRPTHCPRGHEYTDENTWKNKKGYRWCRTCNREKHRRGKEVDAAQR